MTLRTRLTRSRALGQIGHLVPTPVGAPGAPSLLRTPQCRKEAPKYIFGVLHTWIAPICVVLAFSNVLFEVFAIFLGLSSGQQGIYLTWVKGW